MNDGTLGWLYANCFAFVYVSLFEGFGMPVLEAMSCGAAVVVSNTTSLPEVVGNSGLMVNPLDEDAICQTLLQLTRGEQRLALKLKAPAAASRFSWRATAAAVKAVYDELGGDGTTAG